MFRISKDTPAYYLTSVAKDRLPVFRTTAVKNIACSALDEARRFAGFLLLAYVLVTNHLHAIVGSELKPSKVLQYVNGIVAHRVIGFLKTNGHELSLHKLGHAEKDRGYRYSLWDHHSQAKVLTSEDVVIQKVNYVHQNPVRAGLVKRAEDYLWSSVRCWARTAREDEPLIMDIDKVAWRAGEAQPRASVKGGWPESRRLSARDAAKPLKRGTQNSVLRTQYSELSTQNSVLRTQLLSH